MTQSHESLKAHSQHNKGRQRDAPNSSTSSCLKHSNFPRETTTGCLHEALLHFGFHSSEHPWLQDQPTHVQQKTKRRTCESGLRTPLEPGWLCSWARKEVLSHLIRLTTSGENNSDFSIHLRRIHSDQFSRPTLHYQHEPINRTQASRDPWHQISPLRVQPLTVTILEAFRGLILPQCLDLFLHHQVPHFGNHSTLSGASSVRPYWMERQVCAHASHPRDSFNLDQILTNCFLNPQVLDGDVLESSTPTSEHDFLTDETISTESHGSSQK